MYNLFYATNNENINQYGYVLMKDNEVIEQIMFDKEAMAYSDIIRSKIDFLSMILGKYHEINWKRMLITLVAKDSDLIEFYKQTFYKKDCIDPQVRTETFDEKITSDENYYLSIESLLFTILYAFTQ